ncbi:MAG TPA: hypothetical protein VM368_00495 [Flavisolibacter sp.]|nr:hypothetical protein [Flavisolibacter sp.]
MAKENGIDSVNSYAANAKQPQAEEQQIKTNLQAYADAEPIEVDARIYELDHEWDLERALQLNAATLGLAGIFLGMVVDKKWFVLPILLSSFLTQQAVQGWCPPIPLLRKLGFRTRKEIDKERYALKALRGDFRRTVHSPNKAWQSVQ